MWAQGAEESDLTVMICWLNSSRKSILFLKFKTMNVAEQSVMLSSYVSGEILSARRKADNGRPKGDFAFRNEARSAKKKK